MEVLSVNNISKIYSGERSFNKVQALNNISFDIFKGEFVGIMGPSGSGKTTLLNILSGIDKPTSGKVIINGKDIIKMDRDEMALFRRKEVGFIFQDFNLIDSLSIKENIALPMVLDRKSCDEINYKIDRLMEVLDIKMVSNKYPYNVSGGQQQRAAIGRALANNPSIVFADEPTGNLDSKSSGKVMKYFEKMNNELNATMLMVTHDVFAASYCNRVIFIKDGSINFQVTKKSSRKDFLDNIINSLAFLGGEENDV